jgi:hypothetical protein
MGNERGKFFKWLHEEKNNPRKDCKTYEMKKRTLGQTYRNQLMYENKLKRTLFWL